MKRPLGLAGVVTSRAAPLPGLPALDGAAPIH